MNKEELLKEIQEHTALAIKAIDVDNDPKLAIQHLIWVTGWISEQVFNSK